jgi:hypothetical protein
MNFLKYATILPLALSCVGMAQAANVFYKAPFHNIEIAAASKIYVNYNFDSQTQTLVCTANNNVDAITSVEWGYKDTTRKIGLPVNLKDNVSFKGHYADPQGQLTITNEFASSAPNGSIFVSCDYETAKK